MSHSDRDAYFPEAPAFQTQEDLSRWVYEELLRVSGTINQIRTSLPIQTVTPDKPRQAQMLYADGANWNPASAGDGPHVFDGTTWHPLGKRMKVIPVTGQSTYTVDAADIEDHLVLAVSTVPAGGTDLTIDLPLAAEWTDKVLSVSLKNAPADGETFCKVQTPTSNNEVWTGYLSGDYVHITSAGTNYQVLGEYGSVFGSLYMDADSPSVTAGANFVPTQTSGTSYVVRKNVGLLFDDVTNNRWQPAFDMLARMDVQLYTASGDVWFEPRIIKNGATYLNLAPTASDADIPMSVLSHEFEVTGSDVFNVLGSNRHSSASGTLGGTTGGNETNISWRMVRRLRGTGSYSE